LPAHPSVDPYFPIGQAALSVATENGQVRVNLKTFTPNFKRYELRTGTADWKTCEEEFVWKVRPGANRIAVRTVNQFGVTGPVSTAVVEVSAEE
jgi:hypothetical protein